MKRAELEELISAYLDHELAPRERAQVEMLVQTQPQAKEILDSYSSIRTVLQSSAHFSRGTVPAGFSKRVLQSIESTRRKKNRDTAASANSPVSHSSSPTFSSWKSRLSNVRIYAFPAAALLVAVLLSVFYSQPETAPDSSGVPSIASVEPTVPQGKNPIPESEGPKISSPLPESGTLKSGNPPELHAGSNEFTVVCRVPQKTVQNTFFPKLFAAQNVHFNRITDGTSAVCTYIVKVNPTQLRSILEEIARNKTEIPEYSLEKPLENRLNSNGSEMLVIRFQIEK